MQPDAVYLKKLLAIPKQETVSETTIMRRVLIRASELGARLFRNQSGGYRLARKDCRLCQEGGTFLRSGLCPGSADLIGWRSVVITPGMVGTSLAVFVAVELKVPGEKPTDEQAQFLEAVESAGGIGVVVRDVESLPLLLS